MRKKKKRKKKKVGSLSQKIFTYNRGSNSWTLVGDHLPLAPTLPVVAGISRKKKEMVIDFPALW
jgi:hypothetical protein